VSLISGSIEDDDLSSLGTHFAGCFSIGSQPMTLRVATVDAEKRLTHAAEQVARLWIAAQTVNSS